jgi:hypothetical protein
MYVLLPNVLLIGALLAGARVERPSAQGPCALVSREEIGALLGAPVVSTKPVERASLHETRCQYVTATRGTAVAITRTLHRGASVAQQCRAAQGAPVAGLGDAACAFSMPYGAGSWVLVAHGDESLHVLVSRPASGDAVDVARRIAQRALGRL